MFGLPEAAVGAIGAAIITGAVSFVGLILGKENKISEFRQAWIDALRSDLSALISHAHAMAGAGTASYDKTLDLWETLREDFVGLNIAATSIRLRLNPTEGPSKAILGTINAIEAIFQPEHEGRRGDRLNILEKELVSHGHDLLKREWRRVKSGERVYRFACVGALLVFAGGIAALAYFATVQRAAVIGPG